MSFEISSLVPNNDHISVGQKILSVGKIKLKEAIISRICGTFICGTFPYYPLKIS